MFMRPFIIQAMRINLHDNASAVLTEKGADILNGKAKRLNKLFPGSAKCDHKGGDIITGKLWKILSQFEYDYYNIPFKDLTKVGK